MTAVQALKQETEAAKTLIVHLRALGADDDEQAVHDAIEGETSLFEAVSDAVKAVFEDQAAIKSLKDLEEQYKRRRERLENRVEATRAAIANALETANK